MKKLITIILSSIILSSAMAAETGQRILENNYEKKRSNIGNKFMQNVSTGKMSFYHTGVDFKGPAGSLVIAPLDGEVMGVQDKKIKAYCHKKASTLRCGVSKSPILQFSIVAK